jgi:hypothetical protein
MSSQLVNKLINMTVPELWNEYNTRPHTIVDQYIIMELIRRKQTEQLTCQANKNFATKLRDYKKSCIKGISSEIIIKDNDNLPTFSISDFSSTINCNVTPPTYSAIGSQENNQLNSRFLDDVQNFKNSNDMKQCRKKIEAPYR